MLGATESIHTCTRPLLAEGRRDVLEVVYQTLGGCICHSLGSLYLFIYDSTDGCLQLHLLQNYPTMDVVTLTERRGGDEGEGGEGREREGREGEGGRRKEREREKSKSRKMCMLEHMLEP